jgi:hypothetical protein
MSRGAARAAQRVPAPPSTPHADVIFSSLAKYKLLLIYFNNYKKNYGKKLKIPLIVRFIIFYSTRIFIISLFILVIYYFIFYFCANTKFSLGLNYNNIKSL